MRLSIGTRALAADVAGHGPPLVLLHPFPFDRRSWAAVAGRLALTHRVITPDLRGFGESELGGPFTIAELADDVAALLDTLGVAEATVGGISMGGYVALAFAARHPRRLAGLILADTKAGPDTDEAKKGRDEAMALVRAQGVPAYVERQIPRLVASAATDAVRAQVRELARQPADTVVAALAALRDRPDRRPELSSITCPTLVIVGSEDALTPPTEASALAKAITGARLVEIAGAGHLSHLEAPESFAAAVAAFR